MNIRIRKFDKVWFFGVLFVLAFAAVLGLSARVQADVPGPLMAPTPVSVSPSDADEQGISFFTTKVITDDFNSSAQNVADADKVDLQYTIDQTVVAGAANTATLQLQFSCDGSTWTNGVALLSNNTADASDISQQLTFCSQMRIRADVTNNNPLTITISGLKK